MLGMLDFHILFALEGLMGGVGLMCTFLSYWV